MPMSAMPRATKPKVLQPPTLSLAVQYATTQQSVPSRSSLRRWILAALERDATITLRIVDTKEGRELNRNFRNKDYATNVLTFVYSDATSKSLSGDIVLCAPVVAKEARAQRKELRHHYAHLVIHGTLHLQGYDHENDRDAANMERREVEILAGRRMPNPYAV